MIDTPTDDQPGFVSEKPEHCFACFRLIRPGQTYYLTIEQGVLCADCAILSSLVGDARQPLESDGAVRQVIALGLKSPSTKSPPATRGLFVTCL